METRKVLSGLCYFSVFFAGFLFPLVVFLASGDEGTKKHAKKALLSHLIPLIPLPLLVFAIFNDIEAINNGAIPVFTIVTGVIMVIVSIIVVIWNVIKGVKALMME
jgi:protein-S-isoprenylcysteine O-methyltransferase Ste14